MQQIHQYIIQFLTSRATAFLKRSFFFALVYSTMLYILVRLFFYEFPFTIGEGFELHSKIVLVVWVFIIACKIVFTSIVLIENNINNMKIDSAMFIPALKKTILIMLTAALAYAGKTQAMDSSKSPNSDNNSTDESISDTYSNFLVKLPS